MTIIYWMVFGLIAGAIANFMSPNWQGGILGSLVLGILGALVGGFIGESLFGIGVSGFNLMSFAVAIAGSMILLFIGRMLIQSRHQTVTN